MTKKQLYKGFLSISLILAICAGCGKAAKETDSSSIELIDPVNATANIEQAAYRDLYKYETFMGVVNPKITTYAFEDSMTFSHYEKFPGQEVTEGDVLAYGDETSVAESISNMEEKLEELLENHQKELADLTEQIEAKKETIADKKERAQIVIAETERLNHQVSILELELSGLNELYATKQALYELDYNYYNEQLTELTAQGKNVVIKAEAEGTVAALGGYSKGYKVGAGTAVISLLDESEKSIRVEYLTEEELDKASRYFVSVNGKNYDVEYVPYEHEEYESLILAGKTLYSTFIIDDPQNEIAFGSLAVLTVIHEEVKQCLSVSNDALHADGSRSYVYCVEDGSNSKVYVEEGYTDGVYTEILSGISEGDSVLLSDYVTYGEKTQVLHKQIFQTYFNGGGQINYPDYEVVTYDLEHGTPQFVQYEIDRYATVKKGDVVATITVEGDALLLEEKKLNLTRMYERKQDIVDRLYDEEANFTAKEIENLNEQIALKQESIDLLEAEILEMEEAYATTEILANADGIVIWRSEKRTGDSLYYNENLMYIASPDTCYLRVSNTNQVLNYGNEMQIEYRDKDGNKVAVPGKVITVTTDAMNGKMHSDQAYIKLPDEILARLEEMGKSPEISYFERTSYDVTGNPRKVSGVVLVPSKAVFVKAGQTYVYVMDDYGRVTAKSFIAGGHDVNNYWVIEGIEEGMTICLE